MQKVNNYQDAQISAMDETPVWSDMVSQTTVDACGKKTITMKTKGHKKSRVSVCLAARADGTKLKPMIVFKGAARETKVLSQEFKGQAVIASSPNGWMDTDLTHVWVDNVLGAFSFHRRLLAWYSYDCHIADTIKKSLIQRKSMLSLYQVDVTNTSRHQMSHRTKYLKRIVLKVMITGWLQKEFTKKQAGNLKAPPRRSIIKWFLDAWSALPSEMIKNSFMHCSLNLPADGSLDDRIHCFKENHALKVENYYARSFQ